MFDNIRGVTGCPVSGLTPNELFDASVVAKKYTDLIVGNKEFTDLPRKFNVGITGCLDNCTHAASQDIALTPAVKEIDGQEEKGFNVSVGGKMGSGGYTLAQDLDIFVLTEDAAALCAEITLIFRDHGPRTARNKSRLAFLIADWGRGEVSNGISNSLRQNAAVRGKRYARQEKDRPYRYFLSTPGGL